MQIIIKFDLLLVRGKKRFYFSVLQVLEFLIIYIPSQVYWQSNNLFSAHLFSQYLIKLR